MEGHFGWRPEGLCLAAVVVDDRVVNPRTDGQIWLEDGVELYLDGRPAGKQATSPYTPGAYQVLITPPFPYFLAGFVFLVFALGSDGKKKARNEQPEAADDREPADV